MSKHKGGRAAILFILAGGIGVGALAYYVKTTPQASQVPPEIRVHDERKTPPAPHTTETPHHEPKHETPPAQQETVRLPVFGDDISDMALDLRETPVPGGGDAMKFVADKIAEAAHFDGAKALGVDVRDHVAFISYNDAVQRGMGSMEEGAFFRALQIGFGQFRSIDKVTVQVDGKPLESGHFDLSEPLPVIRPGQKDSPEETPSEP